MNDPPKGIVTIAGRPVSKEGGVRTALTLKLHKRQMYGRAELDLLQARLIGAG
jgi:hypothetical protein